MQVGEDSQAYMRQAYAAVAAATPAAELQATRTDGAAPPAVTFYLLLYRGLLLEALGDAAAAAAAVEAARNTEYARRYLRQDYMVALAALHCTQRRGAAASAL